jgi:hypothetical protein
LDATLGQPPPRQPATLLIDDLHIVMIFSPVVPDEQHPRPPAPSVMVIDQQRGGDIQRPNGQVLTGNNARGTTSQQRLHPLTTSGRTVCCKTSSKISAREC